MTTESVKVERVQVKLFFDADNICLGGSADDWWQKDYNGDYAASEFFKLVPGTNPIGMTNSELLELQRQTNPYFIKAAATASALEAQMAAEKEASIAAVEAMGLESKAADARETEAASALEVVADQGAIEPELMERILKEDGEPSKKYVVLFKCPLKPSHNLYKVSIYDSEKCEFYGQTRSFPRPDALSIFDNTCRTYNNTSLEALQCEATKENQKALAQNWLLSRSKPKTVEARRMERILNGDGSPTTAYVVLLEYTAEPFYSTCIYDAATDDLNVKSTFFTYPEAYFSFKARTRFYNGDIINSLHGETRCNTQEALAEYWNRYCQAGRSIQEFETLYLGSYKSVTAFIERKIKDLFDEKKLAESGLQLMDIDAEKIASRWFDPEKGKYSSISIAKSYQNGCHIFALCADPAADWLRRKYC